MTKELPLPHDVDVEEQLLAYVEDDPVGRVDLLAAAAPGDFISAPRGRLWHAWQAVAAEHTAYGATVTLVRDWIRQHDRDSAATLNVLAHIQGTVLTNLPADPLGTGRTALAKTLRRLALQRAGITLTGEVTGPLYARECDPVSVLTWQREAIDELLSTSPDLGITALNEYCVTSREPDPLRDEAFYGLAGDVVRLLEPHTESGTVALLLQFLVYFAAVIGPKPHWMHEATPHRLNLYAVMVGAAGHGRKGTSRNRIQAIYDRAAPNWAHEQIIFGLSSGEGLIAALRDREEPTVKPSLIFEEEFSSPLQHMSREGNILSHVLRTAWDKPNLRTLTRHDPMVATGAYLSLLGHITQEDLAHHMTSTLAGDGLGNRILWAAVKCADHLLPFGGTVWPDGIEAAVTRLAAAIQTARQVGEIGMDDAARTLFERAYPLLSASRPGLFGKLTGRAEAQTRRIACLYALLDYATSVRVEHLQAALAVWEYCEASVASVFGDATGMHLADTILKALRDARSAGLSRTELFDLFQHNRKSGEIGEALLSLAQSGLVSKRTETATPPAKRPTERWFATAKAPTHVSTHYSFNAVIPMLREVQ